MIPGFHAHCAKTNTLIEHLHFATIDCVSVLPELIRLSSCSGGEVAFHVGQCLPQLYIEGNAKQRTAAEQSLSFHMRENTGRLCAESSMTVNDMSQGEQCNP